MTIGLNKWDGLSNAERGKLRSEVERRLPFVDFVKQHTISAKHGSNIHELLHSALEAADCAYREMPTSRLCQILTDARLLDVKPRNVLESNQG